MTPIVMQWAAEFIGKTYRAYYLDGDVLADAQIAVAARSTPTGSASCPTRGAKPPPTA